LKKKIIILGGTGYIGSFLVNFFIEKKYDVISIASSKSKKLNVKATQIKLNLSKQKNIKKIAKILANNIVIICFGNSNVRQKNLIKSKKNTILNELIKFSKGTHWILISSGGTVYGEITKPAKETNSIFASTKYARENVLSEKILINNSEKCDFSYLICRLSNPYGKSFKDKKSQGLINILISNFLKKKTTNLFVEQNYKRDFIHLSDVASALLLLIQKRKKNVIYNISTGKGTSVKKLLLLLKGIFRSELKVKFEASNKNDLKYSVVSNEKLKAIGWKANMDIKKGILKTFSDYKSSTN